MPKYREVTLSYIVLSYTITKFEHQFFTHNDHIHFNGISKKRHVVLVRRAECHCKLSAKLGIMFEKAFIVCGKTFFNMSDDSSIVLRNFIQIIVYLTFYLYFCKKEKKDEKIE